MVASTSTRGSSMSSPHPWKVVSKVVKPFFPDYRAGPSHIVVGRAGLHGLENPRIGLDCDFIEFFVDGGGLHAHRDRTVRLPGVHVVVCRKLGQDDIALPGLAVGGNWFGKMRCGRAIEVEPMKISCCPPPLGIYPFETTAANS